jgi:rplX_bact: ribosomal protein L24
LLLRISTKLQNTANHLLQISRAESLQKKLHCTSPTLCWLLMDRLQE